MVVMVIMNGHVAFLGRRKIKKMDSVHFLPLLPYHVKCLDDFNDGGVVFTTLPYLTLHVPPLRKPDCEWARSDKEKCDFFANI